jgi:hypothetical protein
MAVLLLTVPAPAEGQVNRNCKSVSSGQWKATGVTAFNVTAGRRGISCAAGCVARGCRSTSMAGTAYASRCAAGIASAAPHCDVATRGSSGGGEGASRQSCPRLRNDSGLTARRSARFGLRAASGNPAGGRPTIPVIERDREPPRQPQTFGDTNERPLAIKGFRPIMRHHRGRGPLPRRADIAPDNLCSRRRGPPSRSSASSTNPRRAYLDRRISERKTKREPMRALKRHISRDLFERLTNSP